MKNMTTYLEIVVAGVNIFPPEVTTKYPQRKCDGRVSTQCGRDMAPCVPAAQL